MPIIKKIATFYLYLLSVVYSIIGISSLVLVIGDFFQFGVPPFFVFPGFIATIFGLAPARLIYWTTTNGPFILPAPSLLTISLLGLCAIILGCLAAHSLYKMSQRRGWIKIWYVILGIAGIMTLDNLLYVLTSQERGPSLSIGIGAIMHLLLLLFGILAVKKGQAKSEIINHEI